MAELTRTEIFIVGVAAVTLVSWIAAAIYILRDISSRKSGDS